MATPAPATFAALLDSAVNKPGTISAAYSAFHDYSVGNQLLALWQCHERGIQPGPIATFIRWKELGRHVRRGEKAIVLCRPVTVKRTKSTDDGDDDAPEVFTRFVYKPFWFVLAQTDGEPMPEPAVPSWSKDRALSTPNVHEIAFDAPGNVLGFARERGIAVNPVNPLPWKTRFHEIAHVLLGHTTEGMEHRDDEQTPRNVRELEAESVAMLCCAALGLPGVEFSRGYIQLWWGRGNPIPERAAQRILKVSDQILKAGSGEQTDAAG